LERAQLRRLLGEHRPLLERISRTPPSPVELCALATMLHCFYNGIENILKRAACELDQKVPEGPNWHSNLLDQMSQASGVRPALVSETLRNRLDEYLGFRHVFRHAYTFDLEWERMADLVLHAEQTLTQLEAELDRFLAGSGAERSANPSAPSNPAEGLV
jgi:hypothetical protein